MTRLRLLVLDDYEGILANAPAMDRLRQLTDVTILNHPLSVDHYQELSGYNVLLTLRERTKMDQEFFKFCTDVQLILQTGGHAYHLDAHAATEQGIAVALGRGATQPMVAVPELVFGFMLGLVRQIYPLTTALHNGNWLEETIGGSLSGRTLGILGYGRHGKPVARLAQAFNMQVIAWDRTGNNPQTDEYGVERFDLDTLLGMSDIVSIHLRLSDDSRGLLNQEKLWKMKRGAILINTARGAIVDEAALVEALREKHLAGAGLDVFEIEPLPSSSPLRTAPNVLLTPHIGWKVNTVLHEFVAIAADQLEAWLDHRLASTQLLNPAAMLIDRPRTGGVQS
ncbi:MAG: D-2-hydroxyacid dehydrogenase family protein [Anaerolineae bacterium]|nr:D-2-hydroxyacid dehydrogenase family protein [Anaerolineae bacterium]